MRLSVVPEVLEVQVIPLSDEVSMVPEPLTVTNVLFPKEISLREIGNPELI